MYKRAYTSVKNNCFTPMFGIFTVATSPVAVVGAKGTGGTETVFYDLC